MNGINVIQYSWTGRWRFVSKQLNQNGTICTSLSLEILQMFKHYLEIDTTSEVQLWTDSAAALSRIRFLSWNLHTGRPPANADIASLIRG